MGDYQIQCTECGQMYPDTGSNECPDRHAALQRTVYSAQRLHCADLPGMMRFYDWLPIHHTPSVTAGPVTLPERSACTGTGAFKPVYHVQRVLAGERGGHKNLFV